MALEGAWVTLTLSWPVKETSASLSMPSSWMLSLSDFEFPLDLFMLRKYWPHLCLPASFFSLFSFALLFWNHTWKEYRCVFGISRTRYETTINSVFFDRKVEELPPYILYIFGGMCEDISTLPTFLGQSLYTRAKMGCINTAMWSTVWM